MKLQLVRETKATMNKNLLQFPNEQPKIDCAKKHFEQLGIDYSKTTDDTLNWFVKEKEEEYYARIE